MPENHQSEPVKINTNILEAEADLASPMRVIWGRRYLILAGTAAFVFIALILNFTAEKIYRVTTIIKPGIIAIDESGKAAFIDPVNEIKALIDGELSFEVEIEFGDSEDRNSSTTTEYTVIANNRLNNLTINCETADTVGGEKRLYYLVNVLTDRYSKKLKFLRKGYENTLQVKKMELSDNAEQEKFLTAKIDLINKYFFTYYAEIESIKKRPEHNSASRNPLLDYAATVEIIADLKQTLLLIKTANVLLKKEISNLERNTRQLEPIKIIQPPAADPRPVKPKTSFNVMVTGVVGFFLMFCLSYVLEFLKKSRSFSPKG